MMIWWQGSERRQRGVELDDLLAVRVVDVAPTGENPEHQDLHLRVDLVQLAGHGLHTLPLERFDDRRIDIGPNLHQLLDRRSTLQISCDHKRMMTLSLEPKSNLAHGSRLTRPLESAQHDYSGPSREIQLLSRITEQDNKLVPNNLHHLLSRRQTL